MRMWVCCTACCCHHSVHLPHQFYWDSTFLHHHSQPQAGLPPQMRALSDRSPNGREGLHYRWESLHKVIACRASHIALQHTRFVIGPITKLHTSSHENMPYFHEFWYRLCSHKTRSLLHTLSYIYIIILS